MLVRAAVINAVDDSDYMRTRSPSGNSQELFVTHRAQLVAVEGDDALVEVESQAGGGTVLRVPMNELTELNQPQVTSSLLPH